MTATETMASGSSASPRVLACEGALWVLEKPAGWAVHGARGLDAPDLLSWARQHLETGGVALAPIHRLDRHTSGLVLCSPDAGLRAQLGQQFADGAVHKEYRALVQGVTHRNGTIDRPLFDRRRRRPLEACTRYRRLAAHPSTSYVRVIPLSGRKHQIRRHLRGLGHPIVGDKRYGPRHFKPVPGFPGRLWLHALTLRLPDGREFTSPLPAELAAHLELLASDRCSPQGPCQPDRPRSS